MALKYFYITNNPQVAEICEKAGVDRVFIDMEYIGKDKRQSGLDTVKNHHTIDDIMAVRKVLNKAELLVRVNPVHSGSKAEIDGAINAGADVIMLPMWRTAEEVKSFLDIVNRRTKTILLLEHKDAIECLDEVLKLEKIDEVFIGLNDLHLSQNKKFMFELYTDGTVDEIVKKLKNANITFGIGGVGKVNENNLLPAENILCEHYRLGSSMVILARAFCDWTKFDTKEFERIMLDGIKANRNYEEFLSQQSNAYLENKHEETKNIINEIINK